MVPSGGEFITPPGESLSYVPSSGKIPRRQSARFKPSVGNLYNGLITVSRLVDSKQEW